MRTLNLRPVAPTSYQAASLAGRVVIVKFLATWCFPCIVELPALRQAQKKYAPQGVALVAIGMDLEGPRVLEPFAAHYDLNFPLLLPSDEIRAGTSFFGRVEALPKTFIFAADGRVVAAYAGVIPPPDFERLIEKAIRR